MENLPKPDFVIQRRYYSTRQDDTRIAMEFMTHLHHAQEAYARGLRKPKRDIAATGLFRWWQP